MPSRVGADSEQACAKHVLKTISLNASTVSDVGKRDILADDATRLRETHSDCRDETFYSQQNSVSKVCRMQSVHGADDEVYRLSGYKLL